MKRKMDQSVNIVVFLYVPPVSVKRKRNTIRYKLKKKRITSNKLKNLKTEIIIVLIDKEQPFDKGQHAFIINILETLGPDAA